MKKISPDDFVSPSNKEGVRSKTWRELSTSHALVHEVSEDVISLYEDPFHAFEDIFPLFDNLILNVTPSCRALSSILLGWQWKPAQNWSLVRVFCQYFNIDRVEVYFSSDYAHHCYLHTNQESRRDLLTGSHRVVTSLLKETLSCEDALNDARSSISYEKILKIYNDEMMPRISVRLGLENRAHGFTSLALGSNRELQNVFDKFIWDQKLFPGTNFPMFNGVVKVSEFKFLLETFRTQGLRERHEWLVETSPIDRFMPIRVGLFSGRYRDAFDTPTDLALEWFQGATHRIPYLETLVCAIYLGFGLDNLLPPYVVLEIFDWYPHRLPSHWSRWTKITTIERIHKRMRLVAEQRASAIKKN